ncbi:hypothetical protein PanWU01x14_043430 [Parasponia andersonii]|uniref:Uncharacterized protein n=1 Tax=Parasponia andersonii TaxID=3476 RepID=A0A2P5DQ21_PARAD|nr:hypothetical protein PanWU01x14_043430 [Parasponia andersonii]
MKNVDPIPKLRAFKSIFFGPLRVRVKKNGAHVMTLHDADLAHPYDACAPLSLSLFSLSATPPSTKPAILAILSL